MLVTVKCGDCGQSLGTQSLSGRSDKSFEVHACAHRKRNIRAGQLEAENEVLTEDLARMTGNYQTHAELHAQGKAENEVLKRMLAVKCTAFCGHFKGDKIKARKEYEKLEKALSGGKDS